MTIQNLVLASLSQSTYEEIHKRAREKYIARHRALSRLSKHPLDSHCDCWTTVFAQEISDYVLTNGYRKETNNNG